MIFLVIIWVLDCQVIIYISLYLFISLQVSSGWELSHQVHIHEVEAFCVSMGIDV